MTIGNCSECRFKWPGCGAATNCCFNPDQKTGTMMYPVRGCASHFQPRQERSCENCKQNFSGKNLPCGNCDDANNWENWTPRPADEKSRCQMCLHCDEVDATLGPHCSIKKAGECRQQGWKYFTPRPVSHEPASGETQGPQCVTGETDERVKRAEYKAAWFEQFGDRVFWFETEKEGAKFRADGMAAILRGLLAVVEEQNSHISNVENQRDQADFAMRRSIKERNDAYRTLVVADDQVKRVVAERDAARQERDSALARVGELEAKLAKKDAALEDHVGCGGVCELVALERNVSARLRAEVEEINAKREKLEAQLAKPKGKAVKGYIGSGLCMINCNSRGMEGCDYIDVQFKRDADYPVPVTLTVEE